jgi:hypothetical protein
MQIGETVAGEAVETTLQSVRHSSLTYFVNK